MRLSRTSGVFPMEWELSSYQCDITVSRNLIAELIDGAKF